jgi:hypothetical protein
MMIRLFLSALVLMCCTTVNAQNKLAPYSRPDSAAVTTAPTPQLAATSIDSVNVAAPQVQPRLAPYSQDAPADPKGGESPVINDPRRRQ